MNENRLARSRQRAKEQAVIGSCIGNAYRRALLEGDLVGQRVNLGFVAQCEFGIGSRQRSRDVNALARLESHHARATDGLHFASRIDARRVGKLARPVFAGTNVGVDGVDPDRAECEPPPARRPAWDRELPPASGLQDRQTDARELISWASQPARHDRRCPIVGQGAVYFHLMIHPTSTRRAFLATSAGAILAASARGIDQKGVWPFYVMDTGLGGPDVPTLADKIALTKELGFNGIEYTLARGQIPELLQRVDAAGIELSGIYTTPSIDAPLDPQIVEITRLLKGRPTRIEMAISSKKFKHSDPAG